MKGLIILTLLSLTLLISCQVNILGPPNLVSRIKNYATGPSGGRY